ncbi:hypothetical protein [Legionella tucsonensis]|nr:hypothetical protein [Legionella tucsonensis]
MAVKYKPFDDLDREIQIKRGERYRKNQIDFDNSSIVNSASRVLNSQGYTNFISIMVGQDRVGEHFNLANQLEEKGIDFSKADPRYVFFSLPTKLGEHSVAVVIDREKKKVHIMDSLGENYVEAKKQISQCIEEGILHGYKITCGSGVQQRDEISCGVHSSANIVEVITESIQPEDGHKLPERSEEEVIRLTGLLSTANDDEAADRQKHEKESAIAYRQKNILKSILLKQKPTADLNVLLRELNKEIPPDSEFTQRSLYDFLDDFKKNFPNNKLNAEFKKPKFINLINKYPPLDGRLQDLLEREMTQFFHKKTNLEKLKDLFNRSTSSKETNAEKEARKQIKAEIETANSIMQKEKEGGDQVRIKKLKEIAEDCKKNGITHFPCLEAIKELAENKKIYTGMGYEFIMSNLSQPNLLSINNIDLHIDPYAPLNHAYSHVSLYNGLNSIIDSFISQYERAKNADLLYEWSGNFLGYCLDGQLESAFHFLQLRDQPKMPLHKGMEVFLSEYAKDFAASKWIGFVKTWSDLGNLYEEYQTALAKVNEGQTYLMKRSDIKDEEYSQENIRLLKRVMSGIGTAFNSSRIAAFILEKHPDYEFSDGQKLTEQLIKDYLKNVLNMEEPACNTESTSSYKSVLTQLDSDQVHEIKSAKIKTPTETITPTVKKETPASPPESDTEIHSPRL